MAASTKNNAWIEQILDTEKLDVINDIWQFILSFTEIIVDIAMFICSIYLILSFGVPQMSNVNMITFSLAVMIAAPELLLPGGFMKSAQLRVTRNSKGWPLTIICWCFLLLTIITVGSVVYQLDDQTAKVLVVIRCGLGIAYGILSIIAYREEKSKRKEQLAVVQAIPEMFVPYLQQISQSNQQMIEQLRHENQTASAEMCQSNRTDFASLIAAELVKMRLAESDKQNRFASLVQEQLDCLQQTNQADLVDTLARLEEASTARTNKGLEALMARFQRTISVTVEPPTNPALKAVSQHAESRTGLAHQTPSAHHRTGPLDWQLDPLSGENQTGTVDPQRQKLDPQFGQNQTGRVDPQTSSIGLVGLASKRAEAYILDCLSKEIRPSITDVMNGANVSRGTAIKARNTCTLGQATQA